MVPSQEVDVPGLANLEQELWTGEPQTLEVPPHSSTQRRVLPGMCGQHGSTESRSLSTEAVAIAATPPPSADTERHEAPCSQPISDPTGRHADGAMPPDRPQCNSGLPPPPNQPVGISGRLVGPPPPEPSWRPSSPQRLDVDAQSERPFAAMAPSASSSVEGSDMRTQHDERMAQFDADYLRQRQKMNDEYEMQMRNETYRTAVQSRSECSETRSCRSSEFAGFETIAADVERAPHATESVTHRAIQQAQPVAAPTLQPGSTPVYHRSIQSVQSAEHFPWAQSAAQVPWTQPEEQRSWTHGPRALPADQISWAQPPQSAAQVSMTQPTAYVQWAMPAVQVPTTQTAVHGQRSQGPQVQSAGHVSWEQPTAEAPGVQPVSHGQKALPTAGAQMKQPASHAQRALPATGGPMAQPVQRTLPVAHVSSAQHANRMTWAQPAELISWEQPTERRTWAQPAALPTSQVHMTLPTAQPTSQLHMALPTAQRPRAQPASSMYFQPPAATQTYMQPPAVAQTYEGTSATGQPVIYYVNNNVRQMIPAPTYQPSQNPNQTAAPAARAPARPASAYYVDTYNAAHGVPNGVGVAPGVSGQSWPSMPQQLAPFRAAPYRRQLQDLPTFGGAPEDWPHFICVFEESTREFGLTDLDNMSRLQKAIVGDAKKRVRGILVRPEHVRRTVETLARAFGRPGMLLESQLQEISKMPRITRLQDIVDFSINVDAMVSFLDGPATQHILTNYTVLKDLESKLPANDQRKWAGAARQIGEHVSVRDFAEWLANEADDVSNMKNKAPVNESTARIEAKLQTGKKHVFLNVAGGSADVERCAFCKEGHNIIDCHAFLNLSPKDRLNEAKCRPLCFACLDSGHLLPSCPNGKACGIDGCERRHHFLLHGATTWTHGASQSRTGGRQRTLAPHPSRSAAEQQPRQRSAAQPEPAQDDNPRQPASGTDARAPSTILSCQGGKQKLYYRVVPVVLHGPEVNIRTHALLDEGSSVSLLDSDLATQLGLDGVAEPLDLQFVGGVTSRQASKKVSFGISAAHENAIRYDIDSVQTSRDLSLPTQTVERTEIICNNPHLVDVPFDDFLNVRPQLLLGLEHYHLGVATETRVDANRRGMAAALTKLGWVLYGCGGRSSLPGAVVLHTMRANEEPSADSDRLEMLNSLVRQHFTTEDFGVRLPSAPIRSDVDARAFHLMETTTRRVGTRYETGLLWRQDDVVLPASRQMALNRLRSVEAKMRRDPEYSRQYRQQIKAYVEKGYARKMSPEEAAQTGPRTWYLPHFAVQHASKPGKFRLVFDAAASVKNISLNDALLSGPDLNVPLTRLLFRLRLGRVAVGADIKEMFHQVLIRKEDQDAQRFLWRDGDSEAEPETFVMVAMTFGATCSPTLAQYVKNKNAQDFGDEFPEATAAIQRQHYVDDYVASFHTAEEAVRVTESVIEVHKRGGFHLRGVVSNCPSVQARFESGDEASSAVCLEPKDPTQKILGMVWETGNDTFTFQTRFYRVDPSVLDGSRSPTKREMLSFVMSIFDPFGLLADFLLPSKSMLQELWRLGVNWDDQIPAQIDARWQQWRSQVERTRLLRMPRCYSPSFLETTCLQLHLFADASEEAFAAVAYWRIVGPDGVDLAFVAGKARCAPPKLLSIPRLELQAAVLATRLMTEIRTSHDDQKISQVVFWTDSETVLKWLRCDRRRYAPFVAHRVAEVVESAPADQWRWVPTALNVADDATRVKFPITFNPDSRWLLGPAWLKDEEQTWPQQPTRLDPKEATAEELRPKFVGVVTSPRGAVDFGRFSKWTRLTRCVAWVRRFIRGAQGRMTTGELTAEEIQEAVGAVCRLVQAETYSEEVETLHAGQALSGSSKIFTLKPYLDEDGLLRLHGRTDAARPEFLSSAAKRPIIMPADHHVTMLIVRHHHELMAHQLTNATMASVRSSFWVPKLRTAVNVVRRACQRCRVRSAVAKPPTQGQLPSDRLNAYARPFTNTGVDFFGPYNVTIGRRREKRWAALFTCMAIRAVHIEVAEDMSTDAFIICLRNFCHLRGTPAMIRCDNGTNFVGARNELARDGQFVDAEAVQKEMAIRGIQWRFNCPHNPEAGGAWERLVQAVKRVLSVTLLEEAPRVETFRAVLLEAANIVNSRPLTHLQVDPDDPEPITPNHFLLGGPNVATAPNPADVEPRATRKQWRICRGLSRRFWAQFVDDYLPELTRRSKHYPEEPPLKKQDLVIICDPQQPRSKWTRGVVTEVAIADDGVVRTATVKTATGVCRRPVTRLARLEIGPPNENGVRGAVSATSPGQPKSSATA